MLKIIKKLLNTKSKKTGEEIPEVTEAIKVHTAGTVALTEYLKVIDEVFSED